MKGAWIKHGLVILGAAALLAGSPAASALAADGPDSSAQQIVADCQNKAGDGEGIGACVSAKVQELRDTGDEHAAATADAAQALVDGCRDSDGQVSGECVSAKAQELGANPDTPASDRANDHAGAAGANAAAAGEHGHAAPQRGGPSR
jgi:hypothetical protein